MRLEVLEQNNHLLRQGVELLRAVDDAQFGGVGIPGGGVTAGTHMRHLLGRYVALLQGVESGRVDYDAEAGDPRVETDRTTAVTATNRLLDSLEALADVSADLPLQVKVDAPPSDVPFQLWSRSTLKRELQFLLGHTMHHYAMMALSLRQLGHEPAPDFGIAAANGAGTEGMDPE